MLINLASQIDAVREYTMGWSEDEVLQWLSLYGKVHVIDSLKYSPFFSFEPAVASGFLRGFYFDEFGRIKTRTRW